MYLSDLMSGFTPNASYAGSGDGDGKVLAIDTSGSDATADANFILAQQGITNLTPALNPTAQDRTFLRTGVQTIKTGQQRTFKIVGDRIFGDAFQDYCLAFARKFGKGTAVQVRYIYFDQYTGIGERGKVSIIVNSDGSGEAGNTSQIDIELKSVGVAPSAYTYAAPTLGALTVQSVAGATTGTSIITVTGVGGGQLVYKQNAAVLTPAYGDEASGYTLFESGDQLTLTTGQNVNVAEINAQGKIYNFGSQTITSKA